MNSLRELIETRANAFGDEVYLVYQDLQFTYKDLDRRVNQVARGLSELGICKGVKVSVMIKNCPEFVFVWWAILKLGAVMVPVNLRLTAKEAAYIIDHSESKVAVVGEQSLDLLEQLREDCPEISTWLTVGIKTNSPCIEDFYGLPTDLHSVSIGLEDEAAVLYTSGTTGFAKGVVHTHGNYLRTAASFARTCHLEKNDRLLTANPLFHVNAQFYSCLGTLWRGATFVLAEKFSASRMWDWTRRYNTNKVVMLLALTTILYQRDHYPDDAENPVELVVAGGAPKGHYHDFEKRFGVKLQTLYSLTESPLAIMSPLEEACVDGAVGVPMIPDWTGLTNDIRIFDEAGEESASGEAGQIAIKNQAVMKGYLKNSTATEEVMKGGWLLTGDCGKKDHKGWFYFLGRTKDVIRKKGENISSVEVENVLNAYPGIVEAAVLGVRPPDAAGEEEIMAFVVLGPRTKPEWDRITEYCKSSLADFKIPRFWIAVKALPKNAMKRVVKSRLSNRERPETTKGTFDRIKRETAL